MSLCHESSVKRTCEMRSKVYFRRLVFSFSLLSAQVACVFYCGAVSFLGWFDSFVELISFIVIIICKIFQTVISSK